MVHSFIFTKPPGCLNIYEAERKAGFDPNVAALRL